jgi:GntR family transcriptional regulator, arabinose operon transcriptional repressor
MPVQTPRIVQLATRIERDIYDRHLQPGDAYLNTNEAARMLGVSSVMANRAMQLLAKRRILSRRQGAGAVVADGILQTKRPPLRCVHFLVHQNYLKTEGLLGDGVLIAMQTELPGVDVRLNFLPNDNGAEDIARLIGEVIRSPEPEGFVLVRASLFVQRQVHASGLPAVIYGTPYPSVHGMAWIDSDQRQAGRLLAQYVFDRGCRRAIFLSRDRMLPGDQLFEDGLRESLSEADVPLSGLSTLYLPTDHETIRTAVGNRLKIDGAPLGIVARSEPLAEGAASAVADSGLALGRDVVVVLSNAYRAGNEKPVAFPYVRNAYTPQQVGSHLGRMLALQASNRSVQPNYEIIPVELREAKI